MRCCHFNKGFADHASSLPDSRNMFGLIHNVFASHFQDSAPGSKRCAVIKIWTKGVDLKRNQIAFPNSKHQNWLACCRLRNKNQEKKSSWWAKVQKFKNEHMPRLQKLHKPNQWKRWTCVFVVCLLLQRLLRTAVCQQTCKLYLQSLLVKGGFVTLYRQKNRKKKQANTWNLYSPWSQVVTRNSAFLIVVCVVTLMFLLSLAALDAQLSISSYLEPPDYSVVHKQLQVRVCVFVCLFVRLFGAKGRVCVHVCFCHVVTAGHCSVTQDWQHHARGPMWRYVDCPCSSVTLSCSMCHMGEFCFGKYQKICLSNALCMGKTSILVGSGVIQTSKWPMKCAEIKSLTVGVKCVCKNWLSVCHSVSVRISAKMFSLSHGCDNSFFFFFWVVRVTSRSKC